MKPITYLFLQLTIAIFLVSCNSSNKSNPVDSVKKITTVKSTTTVTVTNPKQDSVELTKLVRMLYKWREANVRVGNLEPIKKKPTDTLYSGINLAATNAAIEQLRKTSLFTEDFLADYKAIAVRMDKELREGLSLWREGDLSNFQDDVNEWCNCQDNPDKYWETLTLTDIKYDQNEANFKWTWGDNFFYKVKAKKENHLWKISYLEGFDMNWYSWESAKKHK